MEVFAKESFTSFALKNLCHNALFHLFLSTGEISCLSAKLGEKNILLKILMRAFVP